MIDVLISIITTLGMLVFMVLNQQKANGIQLLELKIKHQKIALEMSKNIINSLADRLHELEDRPKPEKSTEPIDAPDDWERCF